jgi:hypothetical protein
MFEREMEEGEREQEREERGEWWSVQSPLGSFFFFLF